MVSALLLALGACASLPAEPYWHHVALEERLVGTPQRVRSLPEVCFSRASTRAGVLGCTVHYRETARVYILKGLPPELDKCVETHELMEVRGWRHNPDVVHAYADCGDGTRVTPG